MTTAAEQMAETTTDVEARLELAQAEIARLKKAHDSRVEALSQVERRIREATKALAPTYANRHHREALVAAADRLEEIGNTYAGEAVALEKDCPDCQGEGTIYVSGSYHNTVDRSCTTCDETGKVAA